MSAAFEGRALGRALALAPILAAELIRIPTQFRRLFLVLVQNLIPGPSQVAMAIRVAQLQASHSTAAGVERPPTRSNAPPSPQRPHE